MSEPVELTEISKVVAGLLATAVAIGLAWTRNAKLVPPAESLPGGVRRVSAVIVSVILAIFLVLTKELGRATAINATAVAAAVLVVSLLSSVLINTVYTYGQADKRILGGLWLTEEARQIRRKKSGPSRTCSMTSNTRTES
jgi:hypothetical protein